MSGRGLSFKKLKKLIKSVKKSRKLVKSKIRNLIVEMNAFNTENVEYADNVLNRFQEFIEEINELQEKAVEDGEEERISDIDVLKMNLSMCIVECLKKSDVKKIAVEETNLSNLLSSMRVK